MFKTVDSPHKWFGPLLVFCLCSSLLLVGSTGCSDRVDKEIAMELREGMTKDEVIELAGEPPIVQKPEVWCYRVHGAGDLLQLTFNDADVVTRISF